MRIQNKQLEKENTDNSTLYSEKVNPSYDIIVFCHLRWGFVYQRPQHIISRLSQDHKILMVEEPLPRQQPGNEIQEISPNLHILQPNTHAIDEIGGILSELLDSNSVPIAWFYSPSFSPILEKLDFDHVIYDCMDELSLFKGAPQHLIEQEKYLMAHADIVFTGGKSLYESKVKMHENVHCFPSSVDSEHFAKAKNGVVVPEDISKIKAPIVGYFGVIDERIDLEMIQESAKLLPEISFVMIGPIAKIQDSDLPKLANIHYLGMKSYQDLPKYLKKFDIAMMPFALNDATKFISPTKTLEYMAAGKPIISTRIKDVERDYSDCVTLVSDAAGFSEGIKSILQNNVDPALEAKYSEILNNTSWSATVKKMKSIIQNVTKNEK